MIDTQILNLTMSSASLLVSLAVLYIHLKNRRTQLSSYFLARDAHRSSIIDLKFVSSEQLDDKVIIKLVIFNPGPIATLIQSLTVYKKETSSLYLLRRIGWKKWKKLSKAKWWPTADPSCKEQMYFADEYKSLYVEKYRDIFIIIPGYIDRNIYRFVAKTNHGDCTYSSTIDAVKIYFSHDFRQQFRER